MFAIGDEEWTGVSKALEEMGELSTVFGKLMGSRGETNHWSGDLRKMMIEESADVLAAVEFFMDMNLTQDEITEIYRRSYSKYMTYMGWHNTGDVMPENNLT